MPDHDFEPWGTYHDDFICRRCGADPFSIAMDAEPVDCPYHDSRVPKVRRNMTLARMFSKFKARLGKYYVRT